MFKYNYDTKSKKIRLYTIGDFHYGSYCFDQKEFLNTINKIKNDKNARVILMGDYLDNICPSDPRFDLASITLDRQVLTFDQQINKMVEWLTPIKSKIIGALVGNHETSYLKRYNYDVANMLCNRLDIQYLYEDCILTLKVGKFAFVVWGMHKAGNSTTEHGKFGGLIKKVSDLTKKPHIMVAGHNHTANVFPKEYRNNDNSVSDVYLGLSGSFLKSGVEGHMSYANLHGYPPLVTGYVYFDMDESGNIEYHVSRFSKPLQSAVWSPN